MRLAIIMGTLAACAAPARAADISALPTITVVGVGEVKTDPDIANLAFSIRGEGASPDAATRGLVAKQKAIINGLGVLGGGRMEIRTGEVRLDETRAAGCGGDDDDNPRLSTGKCAVTGYLASISVSVRMEAVKNAGTAVGLAARLGASNAHASDFDILKHDDAARRAAAAALADAHNRAEAIASAAGEKLGPVVKVTDEAATASDGDDIMVTGARVPAPVMVMPPPVAVDIRPEPISTTARLTVTYAIAR
ncbi:MAG TPA: SIMPL domain-containing protein [Sphingomonas sp.]|uniref:SIMPL domain-containing protein n=1 Tax=Sphingomonas sp. TaxID=28214 RepID=UPI002CF6C621|nr:SIMPL domain-containing protein [Sphingomonas sp.]HMI20554.1 SIMPL domain-containing protein [Sphingomonas sp.]